MEQLHDGMDPGKEIPKTNWVSPFGVSPLRFVQISCSTDSTLAINCFLPPSLFYSCCVSVLLKTSNCFTSTLTDIQLG